MVGDCGITYYRGSGDYPELVELQAEVSKLKLHLEKVISCKLLYYVICDVLCILCAMVKPYLTTNEYWWVTFVKFW